MAIVEGVLARRRGFKYRVLDPLEVRLGEARVRRRFTREPILIGGCGRSGTTLLLAVLSAHPNIYAIPMESMALLDWEYIDAKGNGRTPVPLYLRRLMRALTWARIPATATRWCLKTPRQVRFLPELMAFFRERLRFIHIVRDGRDVITSRHPNDPDRPWIGPERWVEDVSAGLEFEAHSEVHTIRYEDLVHDTAAAIGGICDFLDEPRAIEVGNWTAHATIQRPHTLFHPIQDVHPDSIGRWRQPEFAERTSEFNATPGAVELLARLGYE